MAFVTPTDVTVGSVLTASKYNQEVVENTIVMPRGVMGYAQVTANQAGITTVATDLTGVTVSFTANSTRYYRTTFYCFAVVQSTSNSFPIVRITDAAGNQKNQAANFLAVGEQMAFNVSVVETGLSGSVTRKAQALVAAGSMTLAANATSPMFIVVEDIGQA